MDPRGNGVRSIPTCSIPDLAQAHQSPLLHASGMDLDGLRRAIRRQARAADRLDKNSKRYFRVGAAPSGKWATPQDIAVWAVIRELGRFRHLRCRLLRGSAIGIADLSVEILFPGQGLTPCIQSFGVPTAWRPLASTCPKRYLRQILTKQESLCKIELQSQIQALVRPESCSELEHRCIAALLLLAVVSKLKEERIRDGATNTTSHQEPSRLAVVL